MPYRYALVEQAKTLATRPLGRQLRADLLEKAGNADLVELDFSDILSTSHSFADEFVACLAEEVKAGEVDFEICVSGASQDVERVILKALERRSLEIPVLA
jgi:hypothetical protein